MATTGTSATISEGQLFGMAETSPRFVRVARRGPVLRPSPQSAGVYGLDLTAGCAHGCPFCHIRGSSRYPGDDRVLFDPFTTEHLAEAIDAFDMLPRQVVLSPSSDPLPFQREVRAEAYKSVRLLLERGISVQIMTRGRFSPAMIELLAAHRQLVRVAIGVMTLDKALCRLLEPRAASTSGRIADMRRLIAAGVSVEARLEPLIPGRTDTRDQLVPLFKALAEANVQKAVAHYLFIQAAMSESLADAIAPLGWSERLRDDFEGGHVFRLGTVGPTKHLPLETRRGGFARVIAMGAEFGLNITTGASQNPDLPRQLS